MKEIWKEFSSDWEVLEKWCDDNFIEVTTVEISINNIKAVDCGLDSLSNNIRDGLNNRILAVVKINAGNGKELDSDARFNMNMALCEMGTVWTSLSEDNSWGGDNEDCFAPSFFFKTKIPKKII